MISFIFILLTKKIRGVAFNEALITYLNPVKKILGIKTSITSQKGEPSPKPNNI